MNRTKTLFKALNPFYGHAENWLDVFRKDSVEDGKASGTSIWDKIADGVSNWWKYSTHSGMTQQQIEENELMRENRRSEYSDLISGMESAGLNPGLMYQGAPSSSGNAAPAASSGSLSDLLQIAMLPAQIANIKAQTSNIKAQTGLTEQKTRTEEQISRIKKIAADFGVEFTQAQIDSMLADIANKDADTDMKRSQIDLIDSQKTAQDIANEYLPSKYFAEIDKLSADAALARANEAMQRVQYEYARENGVLMSNNDLITLATYLIDLFGISKSDAKARAGKVIEVVNGANNWIDGKIQQASDWFDDRVVKRIKNRLNKK